MLSESEDVIRLGCEQVFSSRSRSGRGPISILFNCNNSGEECLITGLSRVQTLYGSLYLPRRDVAVRSHFVEGEPRTLVIKTTKSQGMLFR